ncbi:MAG: glycosyltransferase [Bacillota bacterium]|nr:glycosyltransferase [Bacillota bacterium]
MKNVLVIIGKLKIGGAEKIGRDIGYYAPSSYKIHYIVWGEDIGDYEKELEEKGCTIHHMAPPSHGYWSFCSQLKKLIVENHIDVIHSHTMFNSGWVMMIGKWVGVPIRISHSHSIRGPEHRSWFKNLYENTMRVLINRFATHRVACGQSAGEWLYGKEAFHKHGILIYNGISLKEYEYSQEHRSRIRQQYRLEDSFVIGHVGHLATVKNQIFLIEMLPELLKVRTNTKLLLLGDGNDKEMLQMRIQELELEDSIIFTGNVSNVGEYMSAMDVFAFPSLYEGMPLALVEAQTNGLPCVVSSRIPKDIHLTDLVQARDLVKEEWVSSLLSVKRIDSELYAQKMYDLGFDTQGMLQKIYALYK